MNLRLFASFLSGVLALAACKSMAGPVPAVLASNDPATMERLKAALAEATGQARVELGPGDPTQTSTLSVLPRPPGPLEDRSLVTPTIFRLEIEGGDCFVVREDGGARARLEGVDCRAVGG
jgi:hypothetical protein